MAESKTQALYDLLDQLDQRFREEEEYLTDLDSAIGDADHGSNMRRGFERVTETVDRDDRPIVDVVRNVGMVLVSEMGGAPGPLYGGSIMHASSELEGNLTDESAVAFAEAYLSHLTERGGATVGEKTMVDSVTPAVHTFKRAIEQDDDSCLRALERSIDACEQGVKFTTHIRARKGRASYLDWRSVGHQDPGATSTLYILEEIYEVLQEYLDEADDEL